jgi:uncharacterized membrane protein
MRSGPWLSLIFAAILAVLLPLAFAQLLLGGLAKLHLTPGVALALTIAMFAGSLVNIPIRRIVRDEVVIDDPLAIFGLAGLWPAFRRERRETILAVNLGGCLIPSGLALYEFVHLAALGGGLVTVALIACAVNIALCFALARPTPNVGILMPLGIPALAAAACAVLLAPGQAAPVAFIAGTMGPLIGADILHLRDIDKTVVGTASIGGAGTFDGIVLSGVIAVYLA